MTLKTLRLPDRYIDRVDTIADTGQKTRDNHLHSFAGGCLENGSDHHDPAAPCDAALTAKAISGEEGNDCTDETSYVVDTGDDALCAPVRIVELPPEGGEADDGAEDSLIISEKLNYGWWLGHRYN